MPQIKTSFAELLYAALFTMMLSGCGDVNSQVNFDPAEGGHISGWQLSGHAQAARLDTVGCTECHGEGLVGGLSGVNCTTCHETPSSVHPLAWGDYTYARHKAYVVASGTTSCANAACHGSTLNGVAESGPSCATACHLGGAVAKHEGNWSTSVNSAAHGEYTVTNGTTSCANAACHGSDYLGVFLSGPSCFQCHPYAADNKHPPALIDGNGHFVHNEYVVNNGAATCATTLCHGSGGTGPSCSTNGCH